MEKGPSEKGLPRVSIETSQDVVSRTMEMLTPKVKERGIKGFIVAANLAVELGIAMKQDGRVKK